MLKKYYEKCTSTTQGIIIEIKPKGIDAPTIIKVQYEVNFVIYEIKETLKLRSKIIKIGFLPIGQMKEPKLKNVAVGESVEIKYNPYNPEQAYIKENIGNLNV